MTNRSRLLVGGVILVGLLLIALAGRRSTAALDPDSTEPDGAKALVMLLNEYAGSVDVLGDVPGPEIEVSVLLDDRLGDQAAAALDEWVTDGGTLVVADPNSPFTPRVTGLASSDETGGSGVDRGACDIEGLEGARRIDISGAVLYETAGSDGGCFGDSGGAFVDLRHRGAGTVISVGGAGGFTNNLLDKADNPVLAVVLMAPTPDTTVGVLRRSLRAPTTAGSPVVGPTGRRRRVGDGSRGLFSLMPDYLRWVALDLALAWLVYALARARRLGNPIEETQPVAIAGSELVLARGRLLRRVDTSATVGHLTDGFRSELAHSLGTPRGTPDERLAEMAAARSGIDAATILHALGTTTVGGDGDLVEFTRLLDDIRQEVQHD